MGRAATRALLLAGALAADDGPAVGQASGVDPSPSDAVAGAAIRSPGAGSSGAGRLRDPFVNPFRRDREPAAKARPRGRAGIAVDELTLRGLVRIAGAHVALLETDGGRSYLFRGGERLFDGTVRSVTAEGVVLVRRGPGLPANAGARLVRLTLSGAVDPER